MVLKPARPHRMPGTPMSRSPGRSPPRVSSSLSSTIWCCEAHEAKSEVVLPPPSPFLHLHLQQLLPLSSGRWCRTRDERVCERTRRGRQDQQTGSCVLRRRRGQWSEPQSTACAACVHTAAGDRRRRRTPDEAAQRDHRQRRVPRSPSAPGCASGDARAPAGSGSADRRGFGGREDAHGARAPRGAHGRYVPGSAARWGAAHGADRPAGRRRDARRGGWR